MKEKQVELCPHPLLPAAVEDSMDTVTKQPQSLAKTETLGY